MPAHRSQGPRPARRTPGTSLAQATSSSQLQAAHGAGRRCEDIRFDTRSLRCTGEGIEYGARADEATASFANGILESTVPLATQPAMRLLEVRDGGEGKRPSPDVTEAKTPPAAA
jgi:hypothetical protein